MMNLSLLKNLMSGDEQLVSRFVLIFKTQVPGQVSELHSLCENKEWEELSSALHSLKTQFNYVGMSAFAEHMREMEEDVDNGQTTSIASRINDFTKQFDEFWQCEFSAG